jgi:hypothetical protein
LRPRQSPSGSGKWDRRSAPPRKPNTLISHDVEKRSTTAKSSHLYSLRRAIFPPLRNKAGHSCRSSPANHGKSFKDAPPSDDANFCIVDFDLIDDQAVNTMDQALTRRSKQTGTTCVRFITPRRMATEEREVRGIRSIRRACVHRHPACLGIRSFCLQDSMAQQQHSSFILSGALFVMV